MFVLEMSWSTSMMTLRRSLFSHFPSSPGRVPRTTLGFRASASFQRCSFFKLLRFLTAREVAAVKAVLWKEE